MPIAKCRMKMRRYSFLFGIWQSAFGIASDLHSIPDFVVVTAVINGDTRA
jgi:hypothetical protein